MFASFLVTFRESLEAALIVGVVGAFLKQSRAERLYPVAYFGVLAAVAASLLCAFLFRGLEEAVFERYEPVFEGATMILAAAFLSYMILWLYRQRHYAAVLHEKLSQGVTASKPALFGLVFFAVLREGIETVLFLNALRFEGAFTLSAGLFGILAAVAMGALLFVWEVKLPLKLFFRLSGVFLIFFAGSLLAEGVGELTEAAVLPSSLPEFSGWVLAAGYVLTALFLFFRPLPMAQKVFASKS